MVASAVAVPWRTAASVGFRPAARRFDQGRFPRRGLDRRAGERHFEVGMATLIGDHGEPGLVQDRELGETARVAASSQRDDLVGIRIAADEIERAFPN